MFYAMLQLNGINRSPLNIYLSGIFLSAALLFLYFWLYSSRMLEHLPLVFNMDISITFFLGPFLFLYFRKLVGLGGNKSSRNYLHFLPGLLSFLILLLINLIFPNGYLEYLNRPPGLPDCTVSPLLRIVTFASDFSLSLYLLLNVILMLRFFRNKTCSPQLNFLKVFWPAIFLNMILLLLSTQFHWNLLYSISIAGVSLIPMLYIFMSTRHKDFNISINEYIETQESNRSVLHGLKTENLMKELLGLMHNKKLYRNENLNLQSLSKELHISAHQLSALLNSKMCLNFRSFVNGYRIQEAKLLLRQDPSRPVLDIAFDVGFNSKSAFNSIFSKYTGQSPSQYRKNLSDERPDL